MNKNDRITIIGYGSQGRALALNLTDSGYDVTVGLRASSKSAALARKENIRTATIPEAVAEADIIIVAIPDHRQKAVLTEKLLAAMKKRPAIVFLHGSAIHFKLVSPPTDLPVLLLAPHAPGSTVRENYVNRKPFSAFCAVEQGPQKKGYALLAQLAEAAGIPGNKLVKTTFAEEAVGDLFGEQAVLCGGLARLLKHGFETLVEAGLPPENAYLEVAYQIDLIVELVKRHGLEGMLKRISPLARYGSVLNGPRVVPDTVRADMKRVLEEIASGKFIKAAETSGLKLTRSDMDKLTSRLFDRQVTKFGKD